jgi:uncharacterized protein (DUF58 family)
MNKFYIKRFEEERNLVVHIVVDSSASMNYGTTERTKFDYASMVGLGFAYMALKNNEKFNFNTFAEELSMIRPQKGRDQLMSIVDHLNDITPTGKSNFLESMNTYKKNVRSKSLIILVSDFLYDQDQVEDVLARYRKSEVVAVQVLDRSEREVHLQGDVILEDSESDNTLRTFLSRRSVKQYQAQLEEHVAQLRHLCTTHGAEFLTTTTDVPVFDVFYEFLTKSEQKNLA